VLVLVPSENHVEKRRRQSGRQERFTLASQEGHVAASKPVTIGRLNIRTSGELSLPILPRYIQFMTLHIPSL
jgi:hypothetical protein